MNNKTGERQVEPRIELIREDHRQRYLAALVMANRIGAQTVLDVGCGVGYGSYMLAAGGLYVLAFDQSAEAIDYAKAHYSHPRIVYEQSTLADFGQHESIKITPDLVVMFEIIEHTQQAPGFMAKMARPQHKARYLIGSVPNELVCPHEKIKNPYHYRHYTPGEIGWEVVNAGWKFLTLGGQKAKTGADSAVVWDKTNGRQTGPIAGCRNIVFTAVAGVV